MDQTTNKPPQSISELTAADRQRLTDQRALVEAYLADEESRRKYHTAPGKLATIRALLQAKVFAPTQTYELQCLGIVLGDALVLHARMEWVMVADEYGRDPAVRLPGTTIILFPLTMISKRIERGEDVDVFQMFDTLVAKVDEIRQQRA